MDYIIGVDLDNTIVSYDSLIYDVALELSFIGVNSKKSKKFIRGEIRKLPQGEEKWQKLQAIVYGPRMKDAQLIHGVVEFFKLCKENSIKVYVISHKTELASFDETKTNLRTATLNWMEKNKFFKADGLSLSKNNVFFEGTREEKIERIKQLACSHFIDDLEETFMEESFPKRVKKILFDPHNEHSNLHDVMVFKKWEDINGYFFKSK